MIKENWFKISIIIILLIVSLSYSLNQFTIYKNNKNKINVKTEKPELPNCDFEIVKGETYKGYFDNSDEGYTYNNLNINENNKTNVPIVKYRSYPNSYWITYTGTIKNKSKERQYLEAMILKIYDNNDIFINFASDNKQDWIEPNKLFSYELHSRSEIDIRDESATKIDIYPWFKTCK